MPHTHRQRNRPSTSFEFDAGVPLTREDRSGYSPYTLSYAFDAASTLAPGTRTAMTKVSGGVTKATAYEYNAGDQLTRMTKVGDGVRNDYYYDDAGCLTGVTKVSGGSSQPWTYQWDAAGRLTRASANGVAATYNYDAAGNRVYRQASGLTKTWTYQGTNIASTADMTTYGTWSNQSYYSVAPGQVGNALERHTVSGGSTSSQYYLYDERGNVQATTDGSGYVTLLCDTDAYGNLLYSKDGSGADTSRPDILLTGKDFDSLTGLYYFNARWYDPETGRFAAQAAYRPDQEHLYVFCGNAPIIFVDVLGDALCIYSISYHMLICFPTEPNMPGFVSDKFNSGQAGCENDPSKTHKKDCGPLPAGVYTNDSRYKSKRGHWRYRLTPTDWPWPLGPDMHGRSGMEIHGPGVSEGCIAALDNPTRDELDRVLGHLPNYLIVLY